MLVFLAGMVLMEPALGQQGFENRKPNPSYDDRFKTSFKTHGEIWEFSVLSLPASWELKRKTEKGWVQMKSMEDFRMNVDISSPEQALDFARLSTSLATHFGFRDSNEIYEILPSERITLNFCYGSKGAYEDMSMWREGMAGVVSAAWFKKHKVPVASSKATADGWLVTRPAVHIAYGSPIARTVLLTEIVKPDGTYSRTERPLKLDDTPGEGGWRAIWRKE